MTNPREEFTCHGYVFQLGRHPSAALVYLYDMKVDELHKGSIRVTQSIPEDCPKWRITVRGKEPVFIHLPSKEEAAQYLLTYAGLPLPLNLSLEQEQEVWDSMNETSRVHS